MSVYITRQQRAVLKYMEESQNGCATANELAERLHQDGESVGLTTVYRQLDRLAQQGLVHRIVTEDGAYYQYCKNHGKDCFLLKCEKCGTIVHLDCSHLGELYAHLQEDHHFTVNPRKTLFYGLCQACNEESA